MTADDFLYYVYLKCSQCKNLSVVTLNDEGYECPICNEKYKLT